MTGLRGAIIGVAFSWLLSGQDSGVEIARLEAAGIAAMEAKEYAEAETHFTELLKLDPTRARISYYLGNVVLGQGDPTKNELAHFCFAQAAAYDGSNALSEDERLEVDAFLAKIYEKWAGTTEGLDELKALGAS